MRFLLIIFFSVMMFTGNFLTMIYGWGIEPENWGWIIAGTLWTLIMSFFVREVSED